MSESLDNLNISIIIPVLNEADRITPLIKSLLEIKDLSDEIIVVDGGSTDGTLDKALSLGVRAISANKSGRAAQMNLGAEIAHGDILWFVHADSRINSDSLSLCII
ncbi:MAG: glycosyltransferase [Synergistaceae bacterium]|nr:glycosyltransferase [Synergistaceae bacterium]